MRTVYSERHRLQDGKAELIDGKLLPCFEKPERAELILARVREVGLGEVLAPEEHGHGAAAARPRRALPQVSRRRVGCLGRRARRVRRAAALLADPEPAPDRARVDRRQAVLLLVRCRHADHRRHLAGGDERGRRRADRRRPDRERRGARGLRALPAARPPCRARLLRRLLLPQQRRDRRPGAARSGRRAGRDPRRRLPPRQRHPGDLLRARRRPFPLAARRPAPGVPVFPRACRRDRGRAGRGAQPQLPAALGHRLRRMVGGARRRLPAGRGVRCGRARGLARGRHLRGRPDLALQAPRRGFPADRRAARTGSGCRPCW